MNKRLGHLKRGSRAADLLATLEFVVDFMATTHRHPYAVLAMGYDGVKSLDRDREEYAKRAALRRLEKQQLLQIEKTSEGMKAVLTNKGINERFRLRVLNADLYEDGRMCMVVFDIPESKRHLRKLIRQLLSDASFIPLQRSVWISPFNATEELSALFTMTGKSEWVRVFEVRELST
ncbi:MAG: hypothetical protein NUV56_04970 [Candidatus Uhrbacteria bacterium]|nr:hypothetical protein [Candidatus Uhrbacteria bacterium]